MTPPQPELPVPQPTVRPGARWSLVLPVKTLARAKTRLAPFAGAHRPRLALAFALDTVTAALACPAVAQVLVVSKDREAGAALAALGALVLADEPGDGLNEALSHGADQARRLRPDAPLAALSADLPALRAAELTRVLGAVPPGERAFLADAPGEGTTLLACAEGRRLDPAFGGASRLRHAAGGARELILPGVPSVRRDVDTAADLAEALALGVGPHTRAAAAALV
ncbi:2-phospho-L-lactate guanylyltransferase [Kitasatospora acidiphila]|uniref:Phosphoenolpyruvate guanylyltransferase n=1 Tax=Kitasatospora acidiphila TaxID=2567942 RepID=A0A540W2U5_9ACTN|nr:2-phospho-L-lactate guanylyltransferase [Kitasatospora acidiphila]TQF03339.1 2-phospho-L-lactate guanylyltransferase [Kitasatospora acidiphila]